MMTLQVLVAAIAVCYISVLDWTTTSAFMSVVVPSCHSRQQSTQRQLLPQVRFGSCGGRPKMMMTSRRLNASQSSSSSKNQLFMAKSVSSSSASSSSSSSSSSPSGAASSSSSSSTPSNSKNAASTSTNTVVVPFMATTTTTKTVGKAVNSNKKTSVTIATTGVAAAGTSGPTVATVNEESLSSSSSGGGDVTEATTAIGIGSTTTAAVSNRVEIKDDDDQTSVSSSSSTALQELEAVDHDPPVVVNENDTITSYENNGNILYKDINTDISERQTKLPHDTAAVATKSTTTTDSTDDATTTDVATATTDDTDDDIQYMKMAIALAQSDGGERGPRSAYPNPTVGAILVSTDSTTGISTVIGRGRSDYRNEAVRACLEDAGYIVAPLSEWVVTYPIVNVMDNNNNDSDTRTTATTTTTTTTPLSSRQNVTLYTTLEPSTRRRGTATPPVTNLIRVAANIRRIVIGCPSPVPEKAMLGATVLHNAGIQVTMMQNEMIRHECQNVIHDFTISSNGKLQRMARKHYQLFGRPLGFMHCSVINSENIEAFRRNGNAFGRTGSSLSYRNFGTYELAPPPDNIWAATSTETDNDDYESNDDIGTGTSRRIDDEFVIIDFEDEDVVADDAAISIHHNNNSERRLDSYSPMMPWYNQVDAIVATFPRSGNGPPNDDSVMTRLNGLTWLATHGNSLAAGVERILVLDATELRHLPLHNTDPNIRPGVDIESFWTSPNRKPVRLLLRRGVHEAARAAAVAASVAAQAAADAAELATNAIESGDATRAASVALENANSATTWQRMIERELETTQIIRSQLEEMGVIIETLSGGEPIDVMEHLGTRNGLYSVVWRAGCWGERGVRAILAGAFQWVSAHIAVPADGGRFWQLMMAENAVQGACGPQSRVKVFADQDDISMEYCSDDDDCVLSVDGKPIRHVRIDCRIALVDAERPREFDIAKTQTMNRKVLVEQAPWFL